MKIQIASDLHLEFNKQHVPSPTCFRPVADRNLLVLAGDICVQMHAKKFVLQQLETSPVIYVPGNHEYYCEHTRASIDAGWYEFARAHSNFHYLVAQSVCIDGLCFLVLLGIPISGVVETLGTGRWFIVASATSMTELEVSIRGA